MEEKKEQNTKEFTGTIIYVMQNAGSKSESKQPFLYFSKEEEMLHVMYEGDNPFEASKLTEFDGSKVTVKGYEGRSNVFIITEISKLDKSQSESEKTEEETKHD